MSIIDDAAAGLLSDLPTTGDRDQNAAILRDRLRDFGLDPDDPATARGALAGILVIREQVQITYQGAALLFVPGGDLLHLAEVMSALEALSVMVNQHRRAGR